MEEITMSQKEKYDKVFTEVFNVTPEQAENLAYQKHPAWDSVGHMRLMEQMETAFDIFLDTEDVVGFSSYKIGQEILQKYGVKF